MFDDFLHMAFIGPGGPEFLVVMLVLLMLFGAKDAPRILRKLNEIISQIRNTADGFKREVMYGDLHDDTSSFEPSDDSDDEAGDDFGEPGENTAAAEAEGETPENEGDDAGKA